MNIFKYKRVRKETFSSLFSYSVLLLSFFILIGCSSDSGGGSSSTTTDTGTTTTTLASTVMENITEETEQDVASETSLDEDMSDDEGREWSELLEYADEVGEFNIDDKE